MISISFVKEQTFLNIDKTVFKTREHLNTIVEKELFLVGHCAPGANSGLMFYQFSHLL